MNRTYTLNIDGWDEADVANGSYLPVYRIREGGARYWVAANDAGEATLLWLKRVAEDMGCLRDVEAFDVERMTPEQVAKVTVRDNGDDSCRSLTDVVAGRHEPFIACCSEW